MLIYSTDNRWRARLACTDDGVSVKFDKFSGVIERRHVNISLLDPGDLPPIMWKQIETGLVTDQPFHAVRDHVVTVLAELVAGLREENRLMSR